MACTITINGTKYTEKQFKNLLKSGLLYNSMERGLVTLPVEVGVITKPETEQTKFRRNFPFSKEDVVLAMINVFGLSNKEAKASAEIADRMAGAWAARNNKTKEDFYKTLVYIKPSTQQLEVTPNLLFSELADFEFVDMMEFEDNTSRSSYIVNRNGEEVGVIEVNQNEVGEYYVSWVNRTGGQSGDGVRIIRTTMQNLINKGLPVTVDTAITPGGFAAMEKLADEGFLIKVGEEIKEENQRSLKPSIYETPPFIINPEVVPNNDKLLFQRPAQVIASVVKGFNLEQNPKGFGLAFNTKNQKASPELASRINTWMAQNNLSGVKFYYEKLYGTINAIVQPQSNMLFQKGWRPRSFQSLANTIKVNGVNISDNIDYVTTPDIFLDKFNYFSNRVKVDFLEKTNFELFRNQILSYLKSDIELWTKQAEDYKSKLINKDGSISSVRQRGYEKSMARVEKIQELYNTFEQNFFSPSDIEINGNLLNQQAQAAILIGQEVADIIYALKDPNVSSPVHELAHKWEKELTEEERNQVLDFAKENNVDITNGWTREVSEAFARGFEKYLAEGIAPTPALERIFKQFAEWLTTIYKGIVGSEIDIELNNDMRKIYATMLGENFETTVKEEVAAEQAAPVVEEVAAAPIEEVTETIEVEEVPDSLSWRTPISETTQDVEAKKQSIKAAYDNKSFDEALDNGTLSLEEVEDIITSAGLPISLVDNILFRMTNPEATYSVLGLLDMKVNAVFQQVANYFIETGLIQTAIDSDMLSTGQAKELLDKIIPSYKSEAFDKLKEKVDTLWNAILKEQESLKTDNLIKKNGFEVGQFVLYQGTKYEIIDENYDGNKRFAGFILKNPLTNKGATIKAEQIKEWTEELEKEYKTTLRVEELKKELGEEAPKKEELTNLKQDAKHTNIQHVGFADVKDKGVSAQTFAQILNISRKFAAMFPSMNIQIGYANDDTKGSVFGNIVRINLKNATQDTPIHELLHPFMVVLKLENPKLYNNLLQEFRNNKPVYNTWLEDVRANSFYAIQEVEVQEEEAFIQYLGEVIASLHDAKGNFIDPVVFVTKVQKKTKQDDIFADETIEEDLDNLTEEELDARAIAEASDLVSEEVVDGKTQEFYEELGYKVTGEVSSTVGVEGRKFTKIKMVHPKVAEITSGFIKNFYKWFLDILKSLTPQTKSGRKAVRFSDLNLAEIDPKTETVKFFKPAKNRAERVDKVEVFDEEGNVIGTEKVKTQRRDDKPSFTISFSEVRESLSKRGASESEISNLINQIESHYNEDYVLSVSLEDSYVPVKDNLTNSNDTKNEESSFFSTDRKVLDVTELPVNMTINDLATLFSFSGDRIAFDFAPHTDALSELEAYQYSNNDVAKDLIERTEKRVKILTATDARIGIESSPTVKSESFAVKELLNKYKDVEFIEAYIRQGISALADAAKMIKYIKEAIKDGEATDEVMNQTLNRDLREAQALMAFYDDVASLIEKNEKMFEQEDLDYFNSIMTRATSRRKEINTILVDLITEWLFPTIAGSQKNVDTKEALTKEEFKKNVRAATSDVNLVSYFGQAPVNSRDPLMAALAIKVKDELNKNYREEENSLQRLRVLYDDFLKATGISNTTKAVEEYYKANFLRKAKVWELVAIEKGGVKRYDYVERWAFHEEYLADVHAETRRQEIERLKKQLGEPNNYDERLIFNERLTAWDNANPLQSAKFRNPAFSNLKSNEYYMFLYDMYKKANDKYADRRLDFGIIPQAYNSPNALEKAKKVAQYTTEVLKGDKKAASKLKELGVSAANAIFDKNSFEKVQALNLDGSYHMSVKSPFTHLLDEQFLSFRLNESVYGFSTSANAYNTLRSNQANVENLKLLINGNTKLGVQARKVLKSKIKTRDGITSSEMVWDVLEGMPPQDKEQSAKLITKQMNAYINDTFYGVSEIGGEFNVGPVVINVNKIADNLGFFTALLNMAGNLIAGVSNITVGNAMSLGESFGGKFYTPKDWIAAQGIYFKEFLTGKFMADAIDPVKSKITQLGIMHDAIQGEFRDKYGKNITGNVLQRYFTKDTLFIINHIAEHQIQLTGMLALMNSTKVKLKDGSEVNLYDAYVKNDKGFYKLRPDAIWSEKQQQEFIRTLHGISRDLNGNYAAYDKAMIQRYALGKLALQYRKYLYTAWRSRFASKRYDYEKGTTQEGYYRAFLKALYADIKEFNLSSLTRTLLDPRVSDRKLTDEQKYAIRKTRYDIVMIVGLTMLSTMLATAEAEAPDDDEDNYWRQLLLLVSLRLRSDLSSYSITAPQELHKILTNPSASFNTVTKFTEFLGQLTNDVQNGQFETYERRTGNNEAGDLKVVGKFEKLIPVYRQWLRLQNPEDQLKYYDLINKNVKPTN